MKKNSLYKEMERWLINYKKNSVKSSSYTRFMNALHLIGQYPIADIPPVEITTDELQAFINALVYDEYAKETIRKTFRIIAEYFDHCLHEGVIVRSVHKGVKLPSEDSVITKKRNVVAYDENEQRRLCKVLERGDSECWFAALMMLDTGMRIGEVMALEWEDIDWRRRCVKVHKTTVRSEQFTENYIQLNPKTASSIRSIALSNRLQRILRKMFEESDDGFIFHDEFGEPLRYDCMKYWIRKACKEADVKYLGQHVFRHTFATNCYYKGCDVKLLSKMLGHSNISTTYNMYIHLYGDALEEMRAIVE